MLVEQDASLWVGASNDAHTVEMWTELFGFGSGDFSKGSEATDVSSDADGRWLEFSVTRSDTPVILEKQRKSPEHLENMACWNKVWLLETTVLHLLQVMPLNDLLKLLEDNGEVNYQIAEHQLTKDAAGNFTVQPLQKVVFCLDAPKPKKKKSKACNSYACGFEVNGKRL